jgi:uncharacterized repeat protein (TIGR02543 family)
MKKFKHYVQVVVCAILAVILALSVTACNDLDETTQYTVTFVTYTGDNSVTAQTVKDGECATEPSDPTRDQFTFIGWYPTSSCDGEAFTFTTPITANTTLYAKWQKSTTSTTSYSVTLNYNYDGKESEVRQVESGATISLSNPTRSGYTFGGWYCDGQLFSLTTAITKDITLVAKWVAVQDTTTKYTITFETNGNGKISPVSVEHDTAYTAPTPTRLGYTFGGWYTDEALTHKFVNGTTITSNLCLYASWQSSSSIESEDEYYTINFVSNSSTSISSQVVESGERATFPSNLKNEGYMLAGWYLDEQFVTEYDFSSSVTSNVTLYADWVKLPDGISSITGNSESLSIEWTDSNASDATVSYLNSSTPNASWTEIESALIYQTDSSTAHADIVGLTEGKYSIKITTSSNKTLTSPEAVNVLSYDRSGYAHFNYTSGVGAYNDDGTLKSGALVIYLTDSNKNDISNSAYVNGKKVDISKYFWNGYKGIGYLLNNRQYNSDTERRTYGIQALCFDYPAVAIRLIGTVNAEDTDPTKTLIEGLTAYNSTDNGGSVGDNGRMARMVNAKNLTIEGVGSDAQMYGWGIHFIANDATHTYNGAGTSFEVRNITFKNYPEDAIGMEGQQGNGTTGGGANATKNDLISPVERCWIHNNVFYSGYCGKPAESDKAEGDGSCDFKRGQYYTLSYNYFESCHKTNLIGSADASLSYNITMHHNWWNNCGSRQPLLRRANVHFYNNYISGDAGAKLSYVTSLRANCYLFSEANYFDGCKNVTQLKDGASKAYRNVYYACTEENKYVEVETRTQTVANNCKFIFRNIDYSSFDTNPEQFYYNSETQTSDCLLDSASQARVRTMNYAGVIGFGKNQTAQNQTTPSSSINVSSSGLTVDLTTVNKKGNSTVSGVEFTNISGVSSGVVKGKGQFITFTLAKETQLTLTSESSGDIAPELISADGRVFANKISGTLNIVLPAGTYVVASGNKAKEALISSLSFADASESSRLRLSTAKSAISALNSTVTLSDENAINEAYSAYKALTSSEKATFAQTESELLQKLNTALRELENLKVERVEKLISEIGEVTANSYNAIYTATTAYEELGTLQDRVTNYSVLVSANEAYAQFAVANVITAIDNLSTLNTIDISDKTAVESAQNAVNSANSAYESLTDEQQELVTNYSSLTSAIEKVEQLEKLFDFKDALEGFEDTTLTADDMATAGSLKTLYESLTAEQKQVLLAEESAKYSSIVEQYNEYMQQAKTCTFIDAKPSDGAFTMTGTKCNKASSSLEVHAYGSTLASGLKLESGTEITLTISTKMTLVLYINNTGKKVNVDGTTYTSVTTSDGDMVVTVTLEAGTHKITKGDSANLYYATLTPAV